jgi:uncharacterized damage-inducible protein DinB
MISRTFLALALSAVTVGAQSAAPSEPLSAVLQRSFGTVSAYLLRAADQFPGDKFDYRATADVRTFAQEIAHVADAHFTYCSRAKGEASPQVTRIEGTVTDRATLLAKLKDSVDYCTAAYAGMTDAMLGQEFEVGRARGSRLGALVSNIGHDNEHYGKIVTYFRLNGLVPPSSQR